LNWKLEKGEGVAEGDFGTVGATAPAFVTGFSPRTAVQIKKSGDNSGRKSKYSPQWRLILLSGNFKFNLYRGECTSNKSHPECRRIISSA
jgi:hypothetical protein